MEYLSFDEKDPNADFPKSIANAKAKYESSNYKEAIVDLNKAIKIQPKYAPAYNLRGLCKAGLKDFKASILDYDKAIKLKLDYAAAYMNRGDSNAHLKRNKKAFEDYLEVTKIDSKNDTAFDYCGLQKIAMGDFKASIFYFDKAININPKNADYFLSRGSSKFNLDNKEAARLDWLKAKKLGSQYAAQAIEEYFPQNSEDSQSIFIDEFDKEIINKIEIHFGSQLKKDSQNLTHNGKIDLKKLLEESFECKISKSAFESLIGVKLTEKSKMQSDKVESPIYSKDEVDRFYDAVANSTDKIIINHWRDEIIENDKWKIFDETSLNQENINEKSDSKYKTSPKTKKRKKDNGSQYAAQAIEEYFPQNSEDSQSIFIDEFDKEIKLIEKLKNKRLKKPTKISTKDQEEYNKKNKIWEERGRDKNLKADEISSEISPKKVYLDGEVIVHLELTFKNALYDRKTEVFGKFPTIKGFKKTSRTESGGGNGRIFSDDGVKTSAYALQRYKPTRIGTFKTPKFSLKINNDIVEVESQTIEVIDKVEEVSNVNPWYLKKSFTWFTIILFVLVILWIWII